MCSSQAAAAVVAPVTIGASALAGGYQIYAGEKARKEQQRALAELANRPTPVPTPDPTLTESKDVGVNRQRRLDAMRYGFASTLSQKPALASISQGKSLLGQ